MAYWLPIRTFFLLLNGCTVAVKLTNLYPALTWYQVFAPFLALLATVVCYRVWQTLATLAAKVF